MNMTKNMKNKQIMENKQVTHITLGQVKQIALEVSKKFQLVNRGIYYNIIDKKTRICSIQGGDKNLVYGSFYDLIEYSYLQLIDENGLYFAWDNHGVDVTKKRKQYVYKIQYKVVELLCGYQYNTGA